MEYPEDHKIILLISDNQVDAHKIERQFMDTGAMECKLYRCTTINAAIEQIVKRNLKVDLVILDIRLHDAGAPEDIYSELKRHSGDIPVIILGGDSIAAHEQTDIIVAAGASGETSRDHFDELVALICRVIYAR